MAAICRKLSTARTKMHASNPTKSGENKFAGYHYFELGDFMPATLAAFDEVGLCGIVSFTTEVATLEIVDTETGASLTITSPMSEATLKGCHPVQNLGAVQTYQRRYLWSAVMELTESDALDSSEPKAETPHKEAPYRAPEVKAPPFKLQEGRNGETFTAHIAGIDESSGEKNGKRWTRHVVSFDNDRKATTFDEKVIGKSRVGDYVSATIKPAKTAGYWDIVALSLLQEEEE
jgi:ERF superfamily protein